MNVFCEKNNQGKQVIFTAIAHFSKHDGRSGKNGKTGKYIFRKKWFVYKRIGAQNLCLLFLEVANLHLFVDIFDLHEKNTPEKAA